MRGTFDLHHVIPSPKFVAILILSALLLQLPCLRAAGPITPSGLNTQVSDPITVGAQTQFNITGGTRPDGGLNLFHSFGEFSVPPNNIANFLNTPVDGVLPTTSNILGRVTGENISNIFGTIQTTGFDNANLFLMNPNGFLFGPNATVNVGGMATFTTAEYIRLTDEGRFNANPNTTPADLLVAAPVAAFGFIGSPHAINFEGGQLTVANGTGIALVGGDINLVPDSSGTPSSITAPGRPILLTSVAGPGSVAADTGMLTPGMALGTTTLGQNTILSTVGDPMFGDGSGNAVSIRAGQLVATGTQILTSPAINSAGQGGAVTIAAAETTSVIRSRFDTSSILANGSSGSVSISAPIVSLEEGSFINTGVVGDGITPITASGGAVTLAGTTSVSLQRSNISTESFETEGNAGAVKITAPTVTIVGSQDTLGIITSSHSFSGDPNAGNGGAIEITGTNVTITDLAHLESVADSPGTFSRGGNIRIDGSENILLDNGTSLLTSSTSQGSAGNMELMGQHVTIREQSALASETFGPGSGGTIRITGGENIAIESASRISTTSEFAFDNQGPAGLIELNAQQLTVTGGSKVSSSTLSNGAGGTITVKDTNSPAQSVLIDGSDSGLFTDTQGTGAGGNITLDANTVVLQNGGTLSAKTSGTEATATGGSIRVDATDQVTMTGGASITASSTDPGRANAGDISINAGQQFEMRDSSVTAEAKQASGGNIDIQAVDRIRVVNSTISSSVQGDASTTGGNITIDPNVVVLQESKIIAQANQGAGGDITITTPLFLADSTSLVSASSQFGLNGTVTIQSPTSNLSGSLGPLTSKPSQAQSLLTQRCAALANGQASSFVVAGREQLQSDPGGWLTSPLAFAALGENRETGDAVASAPASMAIAAQDISTVSLRRLTPAGFLMANFADSEATGCRS
jgi:filamentous hemagglutinin family protein